MAIIDDVITWAKTLPPWQGEVVRRILFAGEKPLNCQDYSDIFALAKPELKLAPPQENVSPVPHAYGVPCKFLSRNTPGTKR